MSEDKKPEPAAEPQFGIADEPGPLPDGVIQTAKPPTGDACGNCRFGNFPQPGQIGVCRKRPPHVQIFLLPRAVQVQGVPPFEPLFLQGFPEVPPSQWCGEYARRPESLQ